MKGFAKALTTLTAGILTCAQGWADEPVMQFFQQEAKVVSASHQPQPENEAPAQVYVITQDEIHTSGAKTLIELFRTVPGVDVFEERSPEGEVSIHGLNKPANNRTLIMVDGRSVLTGYDDTLIWQTIQVSLDEIDRIEIVEGPGSAVFGGNAINGVINIITKTPEQLKGGKLSYTYGDYQTNLANVLYGNKLDKLGYKLGGGWNSFNRFEKASQRASEAGRFNSALTYDFSELSHLDFSAGISHHNTDNTLGSPGEVVFSGIDSFAKLDYNYGETHFRSYWNHEEGVPKELEFLKASGLVYNSYDASLDHAFPVFFQQNILIGTSYRKNLAVANVFQPRSIQQDLWAVYAEDKWQMAQRWSLMTSARVDRHPYTPLMFSPRGTLLFTPESHHIFRASAATAFRNPTLQENYLDISSLNPNPDPTSQALGIFNIQTNAMGSRIVAPERIFQQDLAYNGDFGKIRTTVDGFHYTLKQMIDLGAPQLGTPFPDANGDGGFTQPVNTQYQNVAQVNTWGGQMGLDTVLTPYLRWFGNYTYQYLHDQIGPQIVSRQSPRHKANTGFRVKHEGWTGYLATSWVDATQWPVPIIPTSESDLAGVPAYWIVNANAGYAFSGKFKGLEASLTGFNLLNNKHYELLPTQANGPGQFGEIVRARITGTLSYSF